MSAPRPSVSPAVPESEATQPASRRSFVFLGALAAVAALPARAKAQARPRMRKPVAATNDPIEADSPSIQPKASGDVFAEWQSSLGRLVRRATYGATQAELRAPSSSAMRAISTISSITRASTTTRSKRSSPPSGR